MLERKESSAAEHNGPDSKQYLAKQPLILALLSTLAILCFGAVSGLSSIYHAQRRNLGAQWFDRGEKDLRAARYSQAVAAFRTALLYSRDNYVFQLDLAQALLGEKRTEEASSYLMNLWEREPEDGLVNLELARIAAQKGQAEQALKYYHNAIYATWPSDRQEERQQTRLELIDYLLKIGERPQARSELIALAANAGDDPALQAQLGDLFMKAQDYADALAAYRQSFKVSSEKPAALAGAGQAAFELARYRQAQQYLQAAMAAGVHDPEVADLLKTAELVLQMDPFRRQLSAAQRDRIAIEAFQTAGQRLDACVAAAGSSPSGPALQNLSESWTKMKPHMNPRGLRQDPDLVENAMELVFNIERQTTATCEASNATDHALLLIARLHEGT